MSIKYIKDIDQKTPIDIIIPAAGLGKRMKSYGPKPLIKIKKNLRIIDHQIKMIKEVIPNSQIILVCGFESQALMDNTPDHIIKVENEMFCETNVVRSIGMGLRASRREVLIIYGDLIFNTACLENLNYNKSSIIVGNNIMKNSEVGCVVNRKEKVENLMYDLEEKWGQMIFLKGRELAQFKEVCWNPDNYRMFGFEALNEVIEKGGLINACYHDDMRAVDIDSSKDLEKVKDII